MEHRWSVSVQDFKVALEKMDAAQRAEVAGYLRILEWKETPGLAEKLAEAHARMDRGRKVTQEQVENYLAERRAKK
jgi:hypothetical protein